MHHGIAARASPCRYHQRYAYLVMSRFCSGLEARRSESGEHVSLHNEKCLPDGLSSTGNAMARQPIGRRFETILILFLFAFFWCSANGLPFGCGIGCVNSPCCRHSKRCILRIRTHYT